MSTHNICFCREIRKILCGYPLLSVAMLLYLEYIFILVFMIFVNVFFVCILLCILLFDFYFILLVIYFYTLVN